MLHVAGSVGSLGVGGGGGLGWPRPRSGPFPFSLIRSLHLKDLGFIFIQMCSLPGKGTSKRWKTSEGGSG